MGGQVIVVLMGVSGSGKTLIGTLVAARGQGFFADADDYHSAANKQKMAAGHPLTDEERAPWLRTLNRLLRGWQAAGTRGVLACSALRNAYRSALSDGLDSNDLRYILLDVTADVLQQRLASRHHAFMSPTLLGSQLATLEISPEVTRVKNDREPALVADEVIGLAGWQQHK